MRNFDGLVTDEEMERFNDLEPPHTPEQIEEGVKFLFLEVPLRLAQSQKIKGFRGVMNEAAKFQYICKAKGCLLGGMVEIRGVPYLIFQPYVTYSLMLNSDVTAPGGEPVVGWAGSIPDYVKHYTRPELRRESGLYTCCFRGADNMEPEHYLWSCRHTSVKPTSGFEVEVREARKKKHRALYV